MMKKHFYQKILASIPNQSKVLDLGCGTGDLLDILIKQKNVSGYGVDIEFENIQLCIKKGVPVLNLDIDQGLGDFQDESFDYVILNQTLQEIHKPVYVLSEMLRVGRQIIVTFPNIAYWKNRLKHVFGLSLKDKEMSWFDMPNVRMISITDFRRFCIAKNIQIVKEIPIYQHWLLEKQPLSRYANLLSSEGVFILSRHNNLSIKE